MSQVYKKTDTLVTRDEVVSLLRGTTLVTRPVPSENKTEPLSLHARAWQPESLIVSDNGDDPGQSTQPITRSNCSTASSGANFDRPRARRLAADDLLSLALPTCVTFPFQRLSLYLSLDYARFTLNCLVDCYPSFGKSGGQAAALLAFTGKLLANTHQRIRKSYHLPIKKSTNQ